MWPAARSLDNHGESIAAAVLLALPYLEAGAHQRAAAQLPDSAPLLRQLAIARIQDREHSDLLRSLGNPAFTRELRNFLISWAHREFNVLAPPPAELGLRN